MSGNSGSPSELLQTGGAPCQTTGDTKASDSMGGDGGGSEVPSHVYRSGPKAGVAAPAIHVHVSWQRMKEKTVCRDLVLTWHVSVIQSKEKNHYQAGA